MHSFTIQIGSHSTLKDNPSHYVPQLYNLKRRLIQHKGPQLISPIHYATHIYVKQAIRIIYKRLYTNQRYAAADNNYYDEHLEDVVIHQLVSIATDCPPSPTQTGRYERRPASIFPAP